MFSFPAILSQESQGSLPIFEPASFCPLDLSNFNRNGSTVPVTITQGSFCPQDLLVFNRTINSETEPTLAQFGYIQVGQQWYKASTTTTKTWDGNTWI